MANRCRRGSSLQHKTGFRVLMLLGKNCGGDVREMAANAASSIGGMDALHDAYLAGVKANPGSLPVVKLGGTKAITSKGKAASSTNYEPIWEIIAWVTRPEKLSPEALAALKTGGEAAQANPTDSPPKPAEPEQRTLASVSDDF